MEKIATKQDHVDLVRCQYLVSDSRGKSQSATHFLVLGDSHNLIESFPSVVHADWVFLLVTDMIVGSDKNPNGVGAIIASCKGLLVSFVNVAIRQVGRCRRTGGEGSRPEAAGILTNFSLKRGQRYDLGVFKLKASV